MNPVNSIYGDATKLRRVTYTRQPGSLMPAPARPILATMPRDKWPGWADGVALLRAGEDRGVGDTVERWASRFGGTQFKIMAKAVGLPCRCAERRDLWNTLYPYSS